MVTARGGGRATSSIARGTEILVIPSLPGCRFNPASDRFLWLEDGHRREFRLQAHPDIPGFASGSAVNGCVAFYVASVLVAEVTIWTFIADQTEGISLPLTRLPERSLGFLPQDQPNGDQRQSVRASAAPYDSIFVSYAHEDGAVVARLGMAYKALGMSFLRDQEGLRSGEKWNPGLLAMIDRAHIFQLYWSHAARASSYVRQKWRHALQQKRGNFIRPVFWQQPLPKPPRDLADLHFAYLPLDN